MQVISGQKAQGRAIPPPSLVERLYRESRPEQMMGQLMQLFAQTQPQNWGMGMNGMGQGMQNMQNMQHRYPGKRRGRGRERAGG